MFKKCFAAIVASIVFPLLFTLTSFLYCYEALSLGKNCFLKAIHGTALINICVCVLTLVILLSFIRPLFNFINKRNKLNFLTVSILGAVLGFLPLVIVVKKTFEKGEFGMAVLVLLFGILNGVVTLAIFKKIAY